jgi:hypothetical protein
MVESVALSFFLFVTTQFVFLNICYDLFSKNFQYLIFISLNNTFTVRQ